MSKAVLISIKPEWVEKILNSEKTIEIRKTMPKCELPCKVYIYCTKSKTTALNNHNGNIFLSPAKWQDYSEVNGKVVAEFTLNKVDKIGLADAFRNYGLWLMNDETVLEDSQIEQFLRDSCLTYEQLTDYIGCGDVENWTFENGYAWQIDDLKIYNQPKELSEFNKYFGHKDYPCDKCEHSYTNREECCIECELGDYKDCVYAKLTIAPQSWCYVEAK